MTVAELPVAARTTDTQTADLTVVGGAGHVGIPLVLSFAAKGLTVNVNDLNLDSLAALKAGRLPFIEYGAEELLTNALRDNRLIFTSKPSEISNSGPVIVTIGTPVDEFLNPERHVIQHCIDVLLPYLRDGQLLVMRSTLYPGTTDWINEYLKRRNRSLKVAFCPERIVQGYGVEELARMPQIISGTSPEAAEEAAALFRAISPEIVVLDPIEAEFAKLFGNAYRYIEFAVTNQFYLIAKSAGLDYQRILQAMKYNYPRAKNIPKPGYAAGPCLMKDTMQLTAFARNEFTLGNAAMLVNEGLPLHIVSDLRRRYDLNKMTVGLLGHGVQVRDRRRARLVELQVQEGVEWLRARGPDHRSVRDRRSRPATARRGHRAQRCSDPLHAAQQLQDRRPEGQTGRRRVGNARERQLDLLERAIEPMPR